MKSLYMRLKRFEQYFLKNKLVFCLFVLGGIINTVSVLYCYGNLLPVVANKNSEDTTYTSYYVSFAAETPTISDITEFVKHPLIRNCAFSNGRLCAYEGDYPMAALSGSVEFTAPYQCIVPAMSGLSLGDTVEYYGKEFVVIGSSSSGMHVPMIPYQTYAELCGNEKIVAIDLHAAERQDPKNDPVIALIDQMFPYRAQVGSSGHNLAVVESRTSQQYLWLIVINTFLAVIAHTFTLHYLLDSARNEHIVYTMVGSNKGRITATILGDAVIMSMAANALGVLLHKLLYNGLFEKLNMNPNIQYGFGDYSFCYFIIVALSVLAAIPVVIKVTCSTPTAARRNAL